jgi:hypothetical protein
MSARILIIRRQRHRGAANLGLPQPGQFPADTLPCARAGERFQFVSCGHLLIAQGAELGVPPAESPRLSPAGCARKRQCSTLESLPDVSLTEPSKSSFSRASYTSAACAGLSARGGRARSRSSLSFRLRTTSRRAKHAKSAATTATSATAAMQIPAIAPPDMLTLPPSRAFASTSALPSPTPPDALVLPSPLPPDALVFPPPGSSCLAAPKVQSWSSSTPSMVKSISQYCVSGLNGMIPASEGKARAVGAT